MLKKENNNLFRKIIARKYQNEIKAYHSFSERIDFLLKNRIMTAAAAWHIRALFCQNDNSWLINWKITKVDALILTACFEQKLQLFLKKAEISSDDQICLVELFKQKINIEDETMKIIAVAQLLKSADEINAIKEIIADLPPLLLQVEADWSIVNENVDQQLPPAPHLPAAKNYITCS